MAPWPQRPVDIALAVLRRGDAVLLQRREAPPFAGFWELPGGKVEAGESPAQAALREAREELGLAARAARLLLVHEHRYAGGPWVRLHAFLVEGDVAWVAEAPGRRWVRLAEARALPVLEGTRPVLEALRGEPLK